MNSHLIFDNSAVCFLLCTFSSIWLISCGMRTAPIFIPEEKAKQTIVDFKVQQRDNRVRLSWKLNQTERINRLKKFDKESRERDYFIIHQKLIKFDCRACEPTELPDLKVMNPNDSLIQDGNQVFYYLKFPENSLNFHSYQISHFGPDDKIFSKSQSVRLRRSNVFPKLPLPELEIVQIEDQSQILRFPFGKVVQQKKNDISDGLKIERLNEKEKTEEFEEIPLQIPPQTEFRSVTLRISWPRVLNQSLKGLTGKGDYFEGQELYRNNLYRTINRGRWPETPINIKSASSNYFLDILKMQIIPLNSPISTDAHPDMFPTRIPFYIDLSVKYVDTLHYKIRLVDRFGNESKASETVSLDLRKSAIFVKHFGKKILVPHTD